MLPKRPRLIVLCVDLASVRAITAALSRVCELVWVREAKALMRAAADEPATAAILIDNAVPQLNAIEAFTAVKNVRPNARRILVSDYCDLGLIVQGLHTGAVQNIVYKPIHANELIAALGTQVLPPMAAPVATKAPVIRAAG